MPRTLINPLMYSNAWKDLFLDTPGTTVIDLPKGYYQLVLRGAGGCGGQAGGAYSYAGGAGGAGGPGLLTNTFFLNPTKTTATLHVGEQGKTYANGGNGGQGGQLVGTGGVGGNGGGAGEPSYALINTDAYYANSGAGGGGGGGSNDAGGRNSDGGCGGGGGGRKYFDTDTNTIVAVDGKKGANNTNNAGGVGGLTGDYITFPQVYSGAGGASNWSGGGRSTGGGASGSSGAGRGNHSGGEGGSGGGGAAGDDIAGGGARGGAASHFGENAYNHYTTAIDTTAENAEYGIIGNYGTGGNGGDNEGATGCIVLKRIGKPVVIDEIIDCGKFETTSLEVEWEQKQPGTTSFDTYTQYVGCHDGTTWFFFSSSGYYCTSTDLETFTAKTASNINVVSVVVYGNKLIAMADTGIIYTADKTDPTTWTQVFDLTQVGSGWEGICLGNNEIIAYGPSQYVVKSTDTTNWATWTSLTLSGYYLGATENSMVWDGTQYLAMYGYGFPRVCVSPDGANWTYKGTVSASLSASPRLLGFYDSMYIQVSNSGKVWSSLDGIQWTQTEYSVPFTTCRAGAFSNDSSRMVIVSAGGGVIAIGDNTVVREQIQEIDCGATDGVVAQTINCGTIM